MADQLTPGLGRPIATTICENGRLTLSQQCRQIKGLQVYLNHTDASAELPQWSAKESELVREFQARNTFNGDAERVTFKDNQCFGSLCYLSPYRNIYNPLKDQEAIR